MQRTSDKFIVDLLTLGMSCLTGLICNGKFLARSFSQHGRFSPCLDAANTVGPIRSKSVGLMLFICSGYCAQAWTLSHGYCELGTILCVLQRFLGASRRHEIVYLPLLRFSSSAPQTQGRVPNCFLANWKILVYLRDRLGFFIVE